MAADTRKESSGGARAVRKRSWEALNPPLAAWLLEAVHSMGFNQTTPVQASTIPLFMAYKDVVVEAVTGSGKTLAFLIPIVERMLRLEQRTKQHHVASIIISPTRELASQIHSVLLALLAFHQPSHQALSGEISSEEKTPVVVPQVLVGGQTSPTDDLKTFLTRSPNLLVSTPGRLLELLSSPHVHCPQSSFEVLVLDEADRLLDLGFKDDLQKILARLPKQRRTGLFSASVSEAVDEIVRVGLRNPVKISVRVKGVKGAEDQRTPNSLRMSHKVCKASERLPLLSKLLSAVEPLPLKTIVYFSTCAAVDYFQHVIPVLLAPIDGVPISLVPLHGKHPAKVREKNFKSFSESHQPAVLLTTDLAARGLDIAQVDLVVQMDPPSDPKVFLHRCGRAGRAGRTGSSVIFLQPGREEDFVEFLRIRKTPVAPLPDDPPLILGDEGHDVAAAIRRTVMTDRALHDKAQRGFVSWARAYSKHQASSIFRLSDIDWADQAEAWGLLRLPKMPELRKWNGGDRSLATVKDIDWSAYSYKDKGREAARLNQAAAEATKPNPSKPKAIIADALSGDAGTATAGSAKKTAKSAWSQKIEQRSERETRRSKKHAKREHQKRAAMTVDEIREQDHLQEMIEKVRQGHSQGKGTEEMDFVGFD